MGSSSAQPLKSPLSHFLTCVSTLSETPSRTELQHLSPYRQNKGSPSTAHNTALLLATLALAIC